MNAKHDPTMLRWMLDTNKVMSALERDRIRNHSLNLQLIASIALLRRCAERFKESDQDFAQALDLQASLLYRFATGMEND